MKPFVFISHSSKDKGIAEEICDFLEAHGISCWIAPRDVRPGKDYGAVIQDAIDQSSIFLLIHTADSNKSEQVKREVEERVVRAAHSIFIPFRLEAVEPGENLEVYTSSIEWLDVLTEPLDKRLLRLVTAIKRWQQPVIARAEPKLDAPSAPVEGSSAPASEPILKKLDDAVQREVTPQHVSTVRAEPKMDVPTAPVEVLLPLSHTHPVLVFQSGQRESPSGSARQLKR